VQRRARYLPLLFFSRVATQNKWQSVYISNREISVKDKSDPSKIGESCAFYSWCLKDGSILISALKPREREVDDEATNMETNLAIALPHAFTPAPSDSSMGSRGRFQ
jgi:hypothetical protein